MKKTFKSLMAFAICISAVSVNAQDVITKKSGDEIQAKITEVGQNEIKYKRFDNPDGPVYTIGKSEVFMVKYENGTKDVFKEEPAAQSNVSKSNDNREFWNPNLLTNQRIAGISPFIDLGGFIMSGGKVGIGARWRRLEADLFYKTAPSKFWWNIDEDEITRNQLQSLDGNGFGYTLKVLFPLPNSGSVFHLGVTNEISDLNYVYERSNGSTESWETSFISTGLGGGYAHYANSGFFFRISGYFGATVATGHYFYEHVTDRTRTAYWTYDETWVPFFGTLEASIGWEICTARKK